MTLNIFAIEKGTSPFDLTQARPGRGALDDSLLSLHLNRVERACRESPSEIGPGGCLGPDCTGICMNQMRELAASIRKVHNQNFGQGRDLCKISRSFGIVANSDLEEFPRRVFEERSRLEGYTLLMWYAEHRQKCSFQNSVKLSADIKRNSFSEAEATYAVKGGHPDIVKTMLDKGFDLNAIEDANLLETAIKAGHPDIVDMLLDRGAKPDSYHLRVAAKEGDVRIVKSILDKLGDDQRVELLLNAPSRNVDEKRAIGRAAKKGHTDVVRLLLDRGADPDIRDGNGRNRNMNPILFAARYGHVETVRLLCERGADMFAYLDNEDYDCGEVYDVAKANEHPGVMEVLREFGVERID